jgi:hypothetical protein
MSLSFESPVPYCLSLKNSRAVLIRILVKKIDQFQMSFGGLFGEFYDV